MTPQQPEQPDTQHEGQQASSEVTSVSTDQSHHQPANVVHTVTGWVRSFFRSIATAVNEKTPSVPAAVMLPETVLYASKYREARFGREEVVAMLQPQFKGTGIYVALKFLDAFPPEQEKIMEELAATIHAGKDYATIDSLLIDQLHKLQGPNAQGSTIDGKKVAQIYRQGFDLFEKKFEEIAKELCAGDEVPTLLAYAGTLGLKPFMEYLPIGKKLVIFNPKKVAQPGAGFGYVFTRTTQGFVMTSLHTGDDFTAAVDGKSLVLVDDTKRSGETLHNVHVLFEQHPYWPKIAGERFIASPGSQDAAKV